MFSRLSFKTVCNKKSPSSIIFFRGVESWGSSSKLRFKFPGEPELEFKKSFDVKAMDAFIPEKAYEVQEKPLDKNLPLKDQVMCTFELDYVPKELPFDGPERDHHNFPRPIRRNFCAPSRLCAFPESWFKFFYPKTGVTGPYTLLVTFIVFLVQKELYILHEHDWNHTWALGVWVYIICKTDIGKFFQNASFQTGVEQMLHARDFQQANKDLRLEAIEDEGKQQWRNERHQVLVEAKKENIGLQLEAAYRSNVMELYKQMKRRLDYQVELAKVDDRIKSKFMVQWVINKVKEAIATQSEKDALKRCIADLNTLAARV